MKIQSPKQAFRLLPCLGAMALCVTTCVSANAQMRLSSGNSPAAQSPATGSVANGLFTQGNDSYQVVSTAAFRTAADVGTTEAGSIAQVGFGGTCNSCGTGCGGACGAGFSACGSCGTYCGGACGYTLANPCEPCQPFCYASVEWLYIERDGENRFTRARDFGMSGFDYENGGRVTIGSVPDCVHGYELSYTGDFEWDMAGFGVDAGGGLNSLIAAGAPFVPANFSEFNNAVSQSQTYQAEYWSVEASKTLVGWDIAKLLAGVRYLEYDEDYSYFSQTAASSALLANSLENQLFGVQVGMDLLYPICRNGYTDFRGRLGGFINSSDSSLQVINAGVTQLANFDDRTDFAGVIEIGSGVRYQLGEMLSVRGGVELWYLTGVATVSEQFGNVIAPSTGTRVQRDDDVLFTGVSAGAELKY